MKLSGVNLSSKQPKKLAEFYKNIGAEVFINEGNYDGWNLGVPDGNDNVTIWIWDENKWEVSNDGFVTIVFNVDDVYDTYENLKFTVEGIEEPEKASWGGTELSFKDPDGNRILIL